MVLKKISPSPSFAKRGTKPISRWVTVRKKVSEASVYYVWCIPRSVKAYQIILGLAEK